jgi:ABC-2 type transport system permease protein
MSTVTYTRYELVRVFRNRRFFLFSLGFPLLLFIIFGGSNQHATEDGVSFLLLYMTGMMAWGAMTSMVSSGARIAVERSTGWTRQMRITPLSVRGYFRAKVLSGYAVAALTIAVISVAGLAFGVQLGVGSWARMIGLILIGLIPFALLGIVLGHLLSPDSMGPGIGGTTSLFALLGGLWFPLPTHGFLHDLGQVIPSYWMGQAGKTAIGGGGWAAEGWIVMALWTVALLFLAVGVYQRDTSRG